MATKTAGPKKVSLTLASLGGLASGQAEGIINAALRAAIRDTEDRGSDKKKRKVTIEVEFAKLGDENVTTSVRAKTTLPPYQTSDTVGNLKVDGERVSVEFNPNSPDNPEQRTMADSDE